MQVGCTACQCAKGLCRTMYAPILFHLPGKPGAQLRICHCRQILAELPTMTAEPGRVHGLESADAPGKMRSRSLRQGGLLSSWRTFATRHDTWQGQAGCTAWNRPPGEMRSSSLRQGRDKTRFPFKNGFSTH